MIKKSLVFCLLAFFSLMNLFSQVMSNDERKLYDLIMKYREENSLPIIPVSPNLTFVAQTHVKDLSDNQPVNGNCNMHSWSDKGKWTPCCYTPDHAQANCMWSKPAELTSYKSYGYEISFMSTAGASPAEALSGWKSSPGHNAVITNQSPWSNMEWKAIGVGIYRNYAVVWFGSTEDK